MALPLLLWIGGSIVVAILGRQRYVGAWGFLFFSLIFSPVIGALALFVSGPKAERSPDVDRLAATVQALQATSRQQQAVLDQMRQQLNEARKG